MTEINNLIKNKCFTFLREDSLSLNPYQEVVQLAGRLDEVEGNVFIWRHDNRLVTAQQGGAVYLGDVLYSHADSSVLVRVKNGNVITLGSLTFIRFKGL